MSNPKRWTYAEFMRTHDYNNIPSISIKKAFNANEPYINHLEAELIAASKLIRVLQGIEPTKTVLELEDANHRLESSKSILCKRLDVVEKRIGELEKENKHLKSDDKYLRGFTKAGVTWASYQDKVKKIATLRKALEFYNGEDYTVAVTKTGETPQCGVINIDDGEIARAALKEAGFLDE